VLVEFGPEVALAAIEYRKHLILMNAGLESTLGPILKVKADQAGVILTNVDGDRPGVIMNLYRFVQGKAAADWYPMSALIDGPGIVDYIVRAEPEPGVFILGTHDHPTQQHYLNLYKLGKGPLYVFYTPHHLCHFEVHNTIKIPQS
jgi:predicted homoserine dehydrogenase-like protein